MARSEERARAYERAESVLIWCESVYEKSAKAGLFFEIVRGNAHFCRAIVYENRSACFSDVNTRQIRYDDAMRLNHFKIEGLSIWDSIG